MISLNTTLYVIYSHVIDKEYRHWIYTTPFAFRRRLLLFTLFWQEEVGEDSRRIPSRRSYCLQRVWYASKMEGTCLAGLLLLEVLPSGYVHRVINSGPLLQPGVHDHLKLLVIYIYLFCIFAFRT